VDILCGECSFAMMPMPEYLPRRIVYCGNEKCSKFNIAVEIQPIEVEAIDPTDILVEKKP
jgi:hypothetical protein